MKEPDHDPSKRVCSAQTAIKTLLHLDEMQLELELLRSENNVIFRAGPDIVVKAVEAHKADGLLHEATIIDALVDYSAPVVRPSHLGLGPFTHDNWTVLLLERMTEVDQPSASDEIFMSLASLHGHLKTISVDLPHWTTLIERTFHAWNQSPFEQDQQSIAQNAYNAFVVPMLTYSGDVQPIHGDAWSGQVMSTTEGLRWIDFESACIGPKEWDLAGFETVDGYGPFDAKLWRQLRLVKSWTVAVWCRVHQQHSPELITHINHHLKTLQTALHSPHP